MLVKNLNETPKGDQSGRHEFDLTQLPAAVQEGSPLQETGLERLAEIKPENGTKRICLIIISLDTLSAKTRGVLS